MIATIRSLIFGLAFAASVMASAQSDKAADPDSTADDAALEHICSYVEKETTFGEFQSHFGDYFTRAATSNPDSIPGVLFKPLKWEKQVNAPPEKSTLLMQMFGSSRVPDGLTPYVTGAYVLGYRNPGSEGAISYDQSPESFTVLAALLFQDGILTRLEHTDCP
jgi:hypothetical protein